MKKIIKAMIDAPIRLIDNSSEEVCNNYKIATTNLVSILKSKESNVFCISGINKQDKKIESSINIALTLASQGKNILFVNCDTPIDVEVVADNLTIMENVSKEEFVNLQNKGFDDFDYVVVNIANINDNVESMEIACLCGGIVLIINKKLSKVADLNKILSDFKHVDVKILGVLFIDAY